MYEYLVQPVALSKLNECIEVAKHAVNATIGTKPHQMECTVVNLAVLYCVQKLGLVEKVTVTNRLVYSGKLLIDDSSCTYVEVSDLGVSHLSLGKTHSQCRGVYKRMWVFVEKATDKWSAGGNNSVAVGLISVSKAIQYDQCG